MTEPINPAIPPVARPLANVLALFSEWIDDQDDDDRTHEQLVAEFLAQNLQ